MSIETRRDWTQLEVQYKVFCPHMSVGPQLGYCQFDTCMAWQTTRKATEELPMLGYCRLCG